MARQVLYKIRLKHLQFSNQMSIKFLVMIPYMSWLMTHSEIFFYDHNVEDDEDMHPRSSEMMPDEIADYLKFMHDGQQSLYEGCDKYSKLSFLLKLYHIKCLCRMTDKAMSMILELLADAFDYAKIPCSFYEAKKIIN